jgi:hypothetical protein
MNNNKATIESLAARLVLIRRYAKDGFSTNRVQQSILGKLSYDLQAEVMQEVSRLEIEECRKFGLTALAGVENGK